MKLILTESQIYKLLEKINSNSVTCDECNWSWKLSEGGNDPYVCHQCGHNNKKSLNESEEEPTKYTYLTLGYFNKYGYKRYYFNDIVPVEDDSPNEGKIKVFGNNGDFIFDKSDVKFELSKNKLYVDKSYVEKTYPDFKFKAKERLSEKIGITPSNVRAALKLSFPNNWKEKTSEFSAGLRGIYTIGERLGTNEDWSIMNYFDTKYEIHSLLYLKYFDYLKTNPDDETIDIVDWMSKIFKNDNEFTKMLINRQWSSIQNGLKLERMAVDNFINKVGGGNVTYYPPGSIMDRWVGVDVTINNINYQIKPLFSFKKENNTYVVNTYGMKNYKKQNKINKIVFANNKKCIIFDNKNYEVHSKSHVTFEETPLIL
jgi:hypothetical protein